jgi:hypothetical protein
VVRSSAASDVYKRQVLIVERNRILCRSGLEKANGK